MSGFVPKTSNFVLKLNGFATLHPKPVVGCREAHKALADPQKRRRHVLAAAHGMPAPAEEENASPRPTIWIIVHL